MLRQLLHNQFDVSKICGQCYDGASNMRGEWNGLQALVLKDCPYAYYVHCFAHRLQLALVAASREIIHGIIDDVFTTYSQCGDADATYCFLKAFKFVFILHLIKEVMGKTDVLSQALQKKSQDILNAMELVSATKEATLDKQLHELNSRFNDQAMELLSLSSTLVSKEHPKVIKVDQICRLVEKYYPEDFTEQERIQLRYQLEIFNIDITKNPKLSGVSTIADFCKSLVESQKRETYYLFDRVVRLILTLPASTATTEMRFSAMKIFNNRFRNTMSDDFLANNLMVYIERKIAENIDLKSRLKRPISYIGVLLVSTFVLNFDIHFSLWFSIG
ncbi:uncharacterized protein LOC111915248 [Lactuca sativa]|uniref:uncharacterized protein LOC111915248 n=1 Tax=Lactuca sativa TaxID=4236 RepID=UPI000CD89DC2|nr:uncharacterized protein LOC111915248 [Lactuca sativa]